MTTKTGIMENWLKLFGNFLAVGYIVDGRISFSFFLWQARNIHHQLHVFNVNYVPSIKSKQFSCGFVLKTLGTHPIKPLPILVKTKIEFHSLCFMANINLISTSVPINKNLLTWILLYKIIIDDGTGGVHRFFFSLFLYISRSN